MLKGKYVVLLLAAGLVCWQAAGIDTVNSGIVDPCKSTATSAAGTSFSCPLGDGNALGSAGLTITVTIKDNTNAPIPGVPATDIWLKGCADALRLCGGSSAINADAATDINGVTTISGDPIVSGCDTGVEVVVQGIVLKNVNCLQLCLPIAIHTPDMKSEGLAGDPPACGGDIVCPDGRVRPNDFNYFTSGYPRTGFAPPYKPCLDYVTPFAAPINLGDYSKFSVHYVPNSPHRCP